MSTETILIISLVIITLIVLGFILYRNPLKEGYIIPKIDNEGIKLGCYQNGCFPGQTEFVGRCWLNEDLAKIPLTRLVEMEQKFREGQLFPQDC